MEYKIGHYYKRKYDVDNLKNTIVFKVTRIGIRNMLHVKILSNKLSDIRDYKDIVFLDSFYTKTVELSEAKALALAL